MDNSTIVIRGAHERNRPIVFTGVSGSGKSSLAFDTLSAEGQRRSIKPLLLRLPVPRPV